MRKTKFTWREHRWTNATEDLFTPDKEALGWYRLIIKGAP